MSIHRKVLILSALIVAGGIIQAQDGAPSASQVSAAQDAVNPMRADAPRYAALRGIAEARLRQVIETYAQKDLGQGFPLDVRSGSELLKARIGFGFEVYTVHPNAIMAGASLATEAEGTGHWRFTILVGERAVGLMDVAQQEGVWTAVGFGGSGLAREISERVGYHRANGAGNLRFIRIYQAGSDFLEVGTAAGPRYAPMAAARGSLKMAAPAAGHGLLEAGELMSSLQNAVRSAMASKN